MVKKFTAIIFTLLLALCFLSPAMAATFDDYVASVGNSELSQSAFDPGPNSKYVFLQARGS